MRTCGTSPAFCASLASRVAVLDFGTLIAVVAPHHVLRDPRVARVYLGT
jgi:ABC-type branched-subunit amino acid transport system ATPase component